MLSSEGILKVPSQRRTKFLLAVPLKVSGGGANIQSQRVRRRNAQSLQHIPAFTPTALAPQILGPMPTYSDVPVLHTHCDTKATPGQTKVKALASSIRKQELKR